MKIMIPSEKAKILDNNIEFDTNKNSLVIGNNLEVDGVLKASGGEEVITSAQAVIDEGNPQLNLKQGENIVDIVDLNPVIASGEVDGVFKTLKVTNPVWRYELTSSSLSTEEGFSVENVFSRIQVINNELEIIVTFKITNNKDATSNPVSVQFPLIEIPEEIGRKLIDVNGNDLTTNANSAIAGACCVNNASASPFAFNGRYGVLNVSHQGINKIFVGVYSFQGIAVGATHTYSGRIQLTLI